MAVTGQLGQRFPGHHLPCQKCPQRQHPPLIFSAAFEAVDMMPNLMLTAMRKEELCLGCSSCLPTQQCWQFAALRGKVSNIQEPGQSCRICLDSANVIKVCELTCGQLHRELSGLQLNELVADLGKTKIKPGQVQAVSWSQEPEFQSMLALRE